jgi:uncharacterized protein (DUF1778 family)
LTPGGLCTYDCPYREEGPVATGQRKDARREFRLSRNDDDLLVEAAGLAGVSVSEFVATRALADAETLVHAHHVIELDRESYRKFLDALDAQKGNPAFTEAVRRAQPLKTVD